MSIRVVIIHLCPPGTEQGLSGRLSKELMMCIHFQNSRMNYNSEMAWNQRHTKDEKRRITRCMGPKGFRDRQPKEKVQAGLMADDPEGSHALDPEAEQKEKGLLTALPCRGTLDKPLTSPAFRVRFLNENKSLPSRRVAVRITARGRLAAPIFLFSLSH